MGFIEVSVAAQHTGRSYYTYESDENMTIGTIVQVPFGKKSALGIIRNNVKKPTFVTKKILLTTSLAISPEAIQLLTWMEQFYPYDFGEITNLFIPPNATTNSRKIVSSNVIDATDISTKSSKLTDDQTVALQLIKQHSHVLLHGDTGTGKTRVFLEYANTILSQGKSVLLLTPEIGLTPQLEQTVRQMCKVKVFVVHSQKTPAQRKAIWEIAATNSEPAVYIGPRSSLFLPYKSLGLIVADEAHDNSYKNMQSPKYNGLYVAAKLAKIHGAHFIQSTATPNVYDYAISKQKNIPIARMTTIAAGTDIANGQVIDSTNKSLFTRHPYISDPLIDAISDAIRSNELSLLFLNRRGSARIVQCNACGHIEECSNCGLPMTYHHDTHLLRCHICNTSHKAQSQCSKCSSTDLLYFSPGTKTLEQDIKTIFPTARIARFDLDVSAKDSLHRNISGIKSGQFDIIVGTQIISKGLDIPELTVVGVLNADTGFYLPDFRSEEMTFQQLYQVTGRVGRGHKMSKFFIQTRQPAHPVIESALQRNWQSFYDYELEKRKLYTYPPYSHLAIATITKSKTQNAQKSADALVQSLKKYPAVLCIGPSPSYYESSQGGSTWQVMLKSSSRAALVLALKEIPSEWSIDIDPISIL